MGVLLGGIAKLIGLAGKAVMTVVRMVKKVVFWVFVGVFLAIGRHRRKKREQKLVDTAVARATAAQQPPPEDPPATTPA